MPDMYVLTKTAQTIANLNLNAMITAICVTFIAIVNLIALFLKK